MSVLVCVRKRERKMDRETERESELAFYVGHYSVRRGKLLLLRVSFGN